MKQFRLLTTIVALGALTVSVFADNSDKFEPLIISSGFNRDVVAEDVDLTKNDNTAVTQFATSYYVNPTSIQYTFATKSAMRKMYPTFPEDTIIQVNKVKYELFKTAFPDDGHIVSMATNPALAGLHFQLAPFTSTNNALCLRNINGAAKEGSLKFKSIGAYKVLHLMVISGGSPGQKVWKYLPEGQKDTVTNYKSMPPEIIDKYRKLRVRVNYTEGAPEDTTFVFIDHAGTNESNRVCHDNIYDGAFKDRFTNAWLTKLNCFAACSDIPVDHTRLIESIHFSLPDSMLVNEPYYGKNNEKLPFSSDFGIAIMAVTGEVASDVAVPAAEKVDVKDIEETSFEACWEAIANAASYRLDVATDIDFQHLVEGYNNLMVEGTTCKEVAGLLADHDYYWRIRSVDEAGYQSKSSAPMRVRTAGGETPATDEVHSDIAEQLEPLINTSVSQFQIDRTLYRDGYYNTICLPFNLSADEIAASPLKDAHVFEFDGATKKENHQLDITVKPIDHIVAGVPYLITWEPKEPEIIDGGHLIFRNVTILTNEGQTIGDEDKVRFVGNVSRQLMLLNDVNNLFVGAENTLYWPNTNNPLRGFRAYFLVPENGPAGVPKNSPARIVQRHDTATDIDKVQDDNGQCTKVFRDGQLVIIKNGMYYNAQGQIIYVQ